MIKKSEDPGIFPTKISEGFGRGVPGSVVQAKASQVVQSGGADRIRDDVYHVVNGDPEAIEELAQYYPNWSQQNFADFLAALEGEPAMEENRITDARTRRLAGLPALRENDEDLDATPLPPLESRISSKPALDKKLLDVLVPVINNALENGMSSVDIKNSLMWALENASSDAQRHKDDLVTSFAPPYEEDTEVYNPGLSQRLGMK